MKNVNTTMTKVKKTIPSEMWSWWWWWSKFELHEAIRRRTLRHVDT